MAIQKTIINTTYKAPMQHHVLKSYFVYGEEGVAVANVQSFYSEEAMNQGGKPLGECSIVVKGAIPTDVAAWIEQMLVVAQSEDVELVAPADLPRYKRGFLAADRFYFEGGTIVQPAPSE